MRCLFSDLASDGPCIKGRTARADSGIERPKQLDGKRYASYGARYEGRIVQKMIRNDGGTGEFVEDTSAGMLGAWEALQGGGADATWVFMGWEGALAARKGLRLNAFTLDDYQVCPYSLAISVAVFGSQHRSCFAQCQACDAWTKHADGGGARRSRTATRPSWRRAVATLSAASRRRTCARSSPPARVAGQMWSRIPRCQLPRCVCTDWAAETGTHAQCGPTSRAHALP